MEMVTDILLNCEHAHNPVGIQRTAPLFGWLWTAANRNSRQTGYRLLVASSLSLLASNTGDMWDSGKTASNVQSNIAYAGRPLQPACRYYWKVQLWTNDEENRPHASEPACFTTGLFADKDWQGAKWIGAMNAERWLIEREARESGLKRAHGDLNAYYANTGLLDMYAHPDKPPASPWFRHAFELNEEPEAAFLYVAGLGSFEAYMNGTRIGDGVLENGLTAFDKRVLYSAYDVTDLVATGQMNMLGVWVGRGWYSPLAQDDWNFGNAQWVDQPKLRLALILAYPDGSREAVVSDSSWHAKDSAIVWDDPRSGEIYDARREDAGWNMAASAGQCMGTWNPVHIVEAPEGKLEARMVEPERAVKRIRPISVHALSPGRYVFDFGQAFSGWARLRVRAAVGTVLTMSWSDDVRREKNAPFQYQYGSYRYQQHIYIAKGEGLESYEPRFSYHAGRYVLLEGYPGEPTLDTLEGAWVRTDMAVHGRWTSSNAMLNRLQEAIQWTVGSLAHGYPQDCPHREKNGWLDYATFGFDVTMLNYDARRLFESWASDIRAAQKPNGHVNVYVPNANGCWGEDIVDPVWGAAMMLVPWKSYLYTGSKRLIEETYDAMVNYYDYYCNKNAEATAGLVSGMFGDWLPPGPPNPMSGGPGAYPEAPFPPEGASLVSAVSHYRNTLRLADCASLLNRELEATEYQARAAAIRDAINRRYLSDQANSIYVASEDVGFRQTDQVLPLAAGIVPDNKRSHVFDALVHDIVHIKAMHLDTGTIGTNELLSVLADNGRADVAFSILTNDTFPGWGYFLGQGHTSIPEDWYGHERQSLIHSCYIGVGAYLFTHLAGIRLDSERPGFAHAVIHPYARECSLDFVEASTMTEQGELSVRWEKSAAGASLTLEASIPPNAQATIALPTMGLRDTSVLEGGRTIWMNGTYRHGVEGVLDGEERGDRIQLRVGSGHYRFELKGDDYGAI